MYKLNESKADRIVRLILAIILFLWALLWSNGSWQVVLYILALVMIITSISGFCGLYKIFGFSSNKSKKVENTTVNNEGDHKHKE